MTNLIDFPTTRDAQRRDAIARVLPFLLFIGILAVRSALPQNDAGQAGSDFRWLYGVQAAVALGALVVLRDQYRELARPRLSRGLLLGSLLAGGAVFVLWVAPLPGWAHLGAPATRFIPVDAAGALRWDLITVRGCGAVLVVPVMEELFWRSFLMRWVDQRNFLALEPRATSITAILCSSAVFALAHDLWLSAFIAGLVYAQLYRRTGNIWYAVVAHASTNLMLAVWVVSRSAWAYW